MFRATQIASEETLPALGLLTLKDNQRNSLIKSKENTKSEGYGLVTHLTPRPLKYPRAIVFVVTVKLFEAFAANGIRTILALYLRDDLYFSERMSTVVLHIFNFFGQFCPIFGAILADSYIGNIRTITGVYYLYGFGWILLVLTALPYLGISLVFLVSISLLFIAIGNGSSRACLTSLGATQFELPAQAKQLAEYFSLYYFVYYIGIFLSKILPPMVRADTKCFNKTGCYPAVFGTLASSFFVAWVTFGVGKLYYKEEKSNEDNILLKFCGCIKHALARKCSKSNDVQKRSYWLHYALGKYDETFVNDVAKVLKLAKLFLPLPIYFALLAQQDSSWTFQASQMNTTVVRSMTIEPDQAKAMGPIFLFILIPLWQYLIQPCLKYTFNYELQPLKSVTLGGVFSAFSFMSAGVLQRYIFSKPSKSVSVLWQIPQFLLIMLGELLLSIPGLQFAFTQAPASMKAVVTAAWYLNNAFGNLIVVFAKELNLFPTQSDEYFFYSIIMIIGIVSYTFLAYDYVIQERLGHHYTTRSSCEMDINTETTPLFTSRDDAPSTSSCVVHV